MKNLTFITATKADRLREAKNGLVILLDDDKNSETKGQFMVLGIDSEGGACESFDGFPDIAAAEAFIAERITK